MAAVTYSNEDLNRFWLQIMGDNALVVYNALSPREASDAPKAKALADRLDALLERASQNPTPSETAQINKEAYQAAQDLRSFFLSLLKPLLTSKYPINLKPTHLNLFTDEAERYMVLLRDFMQKKTPKFDPLLEEIYWLPILSIHNRYIADNISYYQPRNRESAQKYAELIDTYGGFSEILQGLSQFGTSDFPMAREHHIAVVDLLNGYYEFLNNLVRLQQQRKLPGSISLLYLDRSRRILCYFLGQMAQYLESKAPDCDPYAKRISTI